MTAFRFGTYTTLAVVVAIALVNCAPSGRSANPTSATALATTAPDTGQLFLPGLVSTPDHDEGGLHVTPSGELYFWRRLPGEKQQIYRLSPKPATPASAGGILTASDYSPAQRLPFSTDRDESPFLTADERTMYFGSERAIPGRPNLGNFDMNVWVTRRATIGAPWSEPEPLPPSFNLVQAAGETWPVANASRIFSLDDETFYASTQMPGDSASRLYTYRRDADDLLVEQQRVDGLFEDPRYSVSGATLSPDGQYLFFNSYGAPEGEGGEDIYVSRKVGDGWSPARALTTLNSRHEEAGPYVSRDGRTLYFSRAYLIDLETYEYTPWSIYEVPVAALGLEHLF